MARRAKSKKATRTYTASRWAHLRACFVLKRENVAHLGHLLTAFGKDVTCEISCSDGLSRQFEDIGDLLAYDNPPTRQIRSIEVEVRGPGRHAEIELGHERRLENVRIWMEGPEADVVTLDRGIEEFLLATRPWYARLATIEGSSVVVSALLSLAGISAAALVAVGLGFITPSERGVGDSSKIEAGAFAAVGILAIFGVIGAGYVWHRVSLRWFPVGTFAIGQGLARYEHQEWIRRTVVVTVVSLVASIVAGLMLLVV